MDPSSMMSKTQKDRRSDLILRTGTRFGVVSKRRQERRPASSASGIVSFLFLLLLSLHACTEKNVEATRQERVAPVHTARVERGAIGSSYAVSGTATAKKKATLSFRVPGFIEKIHVGRGDYISAGSTIAELDASDYLSEVQLVEADLEGARLSLENTRADFDKINGLYKGKATSQQEFERAETALKLAETGLAEVRTRLELVKRRLTYTRLLSPYDCGIVEQHAQAGEFVDTGSPVVSICSLDPLTVEAGIPDAEIMRIREGDPASITFSALTSAKFSGTVTSIAPVADAATRTFTVEISIDNPGMKVKPGMVAWVNLALSTSTEAVTIPVTAVVKDEDGRPVAYVVVAGTDRAEARRLQLGRAFGKEIEVLDGLSVGEEIVIDGQHYLESGQKIHRVKEGKPTP